MADLNKVFLMGRLAFDPELRYTPNGAAVTDLRLATSRVWTSKDGERREDTLFIDVTVWNRQAETCCQYLKKGRSVHIEGFLKTESWDDKTTGEKRSKVKVEAERVQFLGGRDDGGGAEEGEYAPSPAREAGPRRSGGAPAEPRGGGNAQRGAYPAASNPTTRKATAEPEEPSDDDIPF